MLFGMTESSSAINIFIVLLTSLKMNEMKEMWQDLWKTFVGEYDIKQEKTEKRALRKYTKVYVA